MTTQTAQPSDLTPEQILWGRFYRELHEAAERIRKMMKDLEDPNRVTGLSGTADKENTQEAGHDQRSTVL